MTRVVHISTEKITPATAAALGGASARAVGGIVTLQWITISEIPCLIQRSIAAAHLKTQPALPAAVSHEAQGSGGLSCNSLPHDPAHRALPLCQEMYPAV